MLETERLFFRKFTPGDLGALVEMRSDPEVNKYLGGTRLQNPEALEKRMQVYIGSHDRYGYGACAMIWKQTGEMIGWGGLMPLEDTGETEIGYGMKKEFWGKGIGFETAVGWLRYGFEKAGLERIVAVAVPENTGSWRIMEKCGMHYEKTDEHYGERCLFYAVSREEFLSRFPK